MQRRSGSVIFWLVVIGVLAGVIYTWGDDLMYFVTGQDILDDLAADLAITRPTATPAVGGSDAPLAAPPAAGDQPVLASGGEADIASDGFPTAVREHVVKYVVQPGDALFTIAERFGIHPNTVFWANTETLQDNVHLIQAGSELYILPVNGVYHHADGEQTFAEIASEFGVTPGDILLSEFNDLSEYGAEDVAPAGLRIVVPGGRREYISWRSPINTGTTSGAANPEGTIHPGSCRQIYSGTGGIGDYINPLGAQAFRWTQDYAPWHPGLDLAPNLNERDLNIYAAETGVVVFAGWHREGYGELVILDHGEGWTSYYAHMQQRYVDCGEQISKGQLVGVMGSTGNSSGVHLHLEIRKDDVPYNPREFIDLGDLRLSPLRGS